MSSAERYYDIGNKELLLAIKKASKWRHLLKLANYTATVIIDHKKLEAICSSKRLSSRQAVVVAILFQVQFYYHASSWVKEW